MVVVVSGNRSWLVVVVLRGGNGCSSSNRVSSVIGCVGGGFVCAIECLGGLVMNAEKGVGVHHGWL